jgi:hypothetical protein
MGGRSFPQRLYCKQCLLQMHGAGVDTYFWKPNGLDTMGESRTSLHIRLRKHEGRYGPRITGVILEFPI